MRVVVNKVVSYDHTKKIFAPGDDASDHADDPCSVPTEVLKRWCVDKGNGKGPIATEVADGASGGSSKASADTAKAKS